MATKIFLRSEDSAKYRGKKGGRRNVIGMTRSPAKTKALFSVCAYICFPPI